ETPESPARVHGDVCDVVGEVEADEHDDAGHQRWNRYEVEQAQVPRLQLDQHEHEPCVKEQVRRERDERQRQIRPQVSAVPSCTTMQRNRSLDQGNEGHRNEDPGDRGEACGDGALCGGCHCITSWSGKSFAGSRTTRIAAMRPPRVSMWTDANTTWPA